MKKFKLTEVKKNPYVKNFIEQTEKYLTALGFTDHGFRHVGIVTERAISLAKNLNLNKRDQELCAVSAYCHDMGNFLGRTEHHYWSAFLLSQIYMGKITPDDLSTVMQAVVSHDKDELKIVDAVTAILILADKSDVDRSRVKDCSLRNLRNDIHERVNFATTENSLDFDKKKKEIILKVKIDTKITEAMDYFEIFTDRMSFCRQAAKFLGYEFVLVINDFRLS